MFSEVLFAVSVVPTTAVPQLLPFQIRIQASWSLVTTPSTMRSLFGSDASTVH